ncbi:hypothetical protein KUTeg_008566 [Tegillarca granosa]|uniref:PHD-type domain-containing protein n=1 Tax=Tegillarca granosa TaxID=220873 RepID=A0ABQ9FCK4_TEGGR|nr:hypothetical protein KUTeg_008566 [Tegillarca granosa]
METSDQNLSLGYFLHWSNDAFASYLSKRGLSKDGNKNELAALCFAASKLKQPVLPKIQTRSMRDNLVFIGVDEQYDSENRQEDTETVLKQFISSTLGIAETLEFERVHRFGRCAYNRPRSIVAKFSRLGQTCYHIAGLLFRIEAANNLGITSSTSSSCGWNVPTDIKIIEPALMKDLVELTKKSKHGRPNTKYACTMTGSTDPNVILEHLPQLSKIDDLQKQLQEEPMEVDNPSDNVVDNVMGNVLENQLCLDNSHRDQSIACDKCPLWYHFTCVHMTKSKPVSHRTHGLYGWPPV